MEPKNLLILSMVCLCAHGLSSETDFFPTNIPSDRNTIFGDEQLPGEVFEKLDIFSNTQLASRVSSSYRLPTTTRPIHYDVLWAISFLEDVPTMNGTVRIQLHATQANVNQIVIHSDDLTIENVQLTQGTTILPVTFEVSEQNQLLIITLATGNLPFSTNPANPVIHQLQIEFRANLRNDMYGIYNNWFRNNATDQIRYMASTQFQATAARWAFPCYDEPSFKATFNVTIRRQIGYESWFCTRLIESVPSENTPGFEDDIYHETPIMSTYLLAIIVAQYDYIKLNNSEGLLTYEVIARPGAIEAGQGEFAFEFGQELLSEMSNHTNYDFYSQHPHLKMTQAAIPDFGAGAMENWGLLTYREAYLMYDPEETNSNFKQIIAYILSHEIAHMWFGNLVTCDWWDSLWLNEGFARYYQYFLTEWVGGMGFRTRFITEQVHTALLSDSANNPQPLTNPGLNSNAAVSAMFSTISYNKGAAVIRMTEHLLGYEVHRQGLRNYLVEREFQTAVPLQLFQHLEQAGNANGALNYGPDFSFIDYYKSFTEQPGHPVLNVQVDHRTGQMRIYQRRFNINTGYSTIGNNYIVPITFASASNPNFENTKPTHIISQAISTINRGSVGDEWVIFNVQQTGFYRVNYDNYTWDLIALALRSNNRTLIHEYNRAQIVNDVFQYARADIMDYSRALNILSFLQYETDYAPWAAALTGFSWLRNRLQSAPTTTELNQLNNLIVQWAARVMSSLTYNPIPGEDFLRSYLRFQLAALMCNLGVQECIDEARAQFAALSVNGTPVPVDNRNWVYCNGLRHGTALDFNFLWNRFLTHNVYTEKILILQNIGCTRDPASLRTLLMNIVEDNFIIRPQDYTSTFSNAVNGNEENTQIVLEFIQQNLALVANAFGGSVATPMSYVLARLRSQAAVNNARTWAFINQQALGTAYNSVLNNIASAESSINWAVSIQPNLSSYLVGGGDPIETSTPEPVTTANVSTTEQPLITMPVTPSLPTTPSSATTSFVTAATIVMVMLANTIL
ncbi:unnamed protein product [Arctia plantaginis]|uniref:Aminopeptidase n=1 Tax=Arctia plantaginis TaxID=874455 RepID=A0A8S0YN89_ARCPL|nr:unnamed protein product [Arctia plantaginis]CAB3239511.1 unnamed protein product [Arctia plantaginis]